MNYKIREINWNQKNKDGIPYDCIDVMNYFNRDLKKGKYPYVPRKNNLITRNEIKNKWIPNKNRNITYVAEDLKLNKIIASATISLIQNKKEGILQITKDSNYKIKGIGTELTKKMIKIASSKGITIIIRTSVKNKSAIKVIKKLGYGEGELIKNFEPYRNKIKGSSYDVFEWIIKS